jgi:hypothetical protein
MNYYVTARPPNKIKRELIALEFRPTPPPLPPAPAGWKKAMEMPGFPHDGKD